jgi:hypothetical protein
LNKPKCQNPKEKSERETAQVQMTKLKCQINVKIQRTNKGQSPNDKSEGKAWTSSNVKAQMPNKAQNPNV